MLGDGGADAPPLSIMPNAGLPQRLEGRFVYAAGADYFADVTSRMLDAGARIVGGCCGTTPAHIAAMRAVLDAGTGARSGAMPAPRSRPPASRPSHGPPRIEPVAASTAVW